jgi:sugar lactone lactonase YvrE
MKRLALFFCTGAAILLGQAVTYEIISTVAGGGPDAITNEGGAAVNTPLVYPRAIALDPAGNLYIADSGASRIRMVDPQGMISTVAGSGRTGFGSNTGPATLVAVPFPWGVATDSSGDIFTLDVQGRIEKVTPDNIIHQVASEPQLPRSTTWIAGAGQIGMVADQNGNLYVADPAENRVLRITPNGDKVTVAGNGTQGFGGDEGPATAAMMNQPSGLALDSAGNLYIADSENNRLRMVSTDGVIHTVAGTGNRATGPDGQPATSTDLNAVTSVAVDSSDTVYLSEFNRVRKISAGKLTTIAGGGNGSDGGPAVSAFMTGIGSLAITASGDVYIGEVVNHRIRRVRAGTGLIETVAGTVKPLGDGGPAISAELDLPEGVALDRKGNLYIVEATNARVRKVASDGTITTFAGTGLPTFSGDGGPAALAGLSAPTAVATDAAGNVYIADSNNVRVRKVTPDGNISTIAGGGTTPAADGVPASSARFLGNIPGPVGIVAADNGDLYFAEADPAYIWRLTPDGVLHIAAGTGQDAIGPDTGPALSIPLDLQTRTLVGMVLDPQGNLYFSETLGYRVRKLSPNGTLTTIAGTGKQGSQGEGGLATSASLGEPTGLALDSAGSLYVADVANSWIHKISPDGIITRYAGTFAGYRGDGMPAAVSSLWGPFGLALSPGGALYLSDYNNNRIRKIAPGTITAGQ